MFFSVKKITIGYGLVMFWLCFGFILVSFWFFSGLIEVFLNGGVERNAADRLGPVAESCNELKDIFASNSR